MVDGEDPGFLVLGGRAVDPFDDVGVHPLVPKRVVVELGDLRQVVDPRPWRPVIVVQPGLDFRGGDLAQPTVREILGEGGQPEFQFCDGAVTVIGNVW